MNKYQAFRRIFACLLLASLASVSSAATLKVHNGATQDEIQAVINSALAGDTICFDPGTYHFTRSLTLKDDITIKGSGCTWNGNNTTNIVKVIDAGRLNNVTIKNLVANNVMFRLWGASSASSVNNITFCNITFQNGLIESGLAQIDSRYLQFKATNVTVSGCKFLRTSSFPGKCMQLYRAENVNFTNNLVGATSWLRPSPEVHGYFKTVVNMNSDSVVGGLVNAVIRGNCIYRSKTMAIDSTHSDHGIYAHGFNSLVIENNLISGWPATATGGAVKIRNGQNATIAGNWFIRSGILMYVYQTGYYKFLKNVDVIGNIIIQDSWDGVPSIHKGIGFWRDYATTAEAEYSIYISNNIITQGCIDIADNTHVADFNAEGGGIFNNLILTGAIEAPAGIAQSGNVIYP